MQFIYKDVPFKVDSSLGTYRAILNNLPVTGTDSKSPGEASMRLMNMIDEMQDFESKPMQPGDAYEFEGKVGLISKMGDVVELREGLGGDTTNFRGPPSACNYDQYPTVTLAGGPFTELRRGSFMAEWVGVTSIEFWAWQANPEADGGFKYQKDVNVWRLTKI